MNSNQRNAKKKNFRSRKPPKNRTKNKNNKDAAPFVYNGPKIQKSLSRNAPFPPSMTRKLSLNHPVFQVNDAAASFKLVEWRLNDVYDPFNSGSLGTVAGYQQMATIYDSYRVSNNTVQFQVGNNEVANLYCGIIFRDVQPSTIITTNLIVQNSLEIGPSSGPIAVSAYTGNGIYRSRRYKMDIGALLGNYASYMSDLSYTAATGTSPNQALWVAFIVYKPNGSLLAGGVNLNMVITFTTKFYSIKTNLGASPINFLSQNIIMGPQLVELVSPDPPPDVDFSVLEEEWRSLRKVMNKYTPLQEGRDIVWETLFKREQELFFQLFPSGQHTEVGKSPRVFQSGCSNIN